MLFGFVVCNPGQFILALVLFTFPCRCCIYKQHSHGAWLWPANAPHPQRHPLTMSYWASASAARQLRREYLTGRYTTSWDELPVARIR
ncbi:DUF4113 domain-containing protein [Chromohalobacter canadensis]|uniref:DUF4113 domain-containing protein n=1 Tax=Chromohalobacter canadensis TaxID=141389 RepID=UPI0035F0B8B2